MELGEGLADRSAMGRMRPPDPHAVEKRHDGGGALRELPERRTDAIVHRLRTGEPARGQMLDQIEKKRQIAGGDAFFIEGEDKKAAARVQQEVRILNPFGNSLIGQQAADIVAGKEGAEAGSSQLWTPGS